MRLVVGAGDRRPTGYTYHDVQPLEGIDIVCELFDLPKHVKNSSCQVIQMTHVLEHFPIAKVQDVLNLVYNLLVPGGELYIEVPNFKWHALMILEDPFNRQIVEYAYGGQLNEWDYHYNGFTPETLAQDLITAGFKITNLEPNSSIECRATK